MAKIAPPKPRATIEDDPHRLRITIPVKTNWLVTLGVALWIVVWIASGVTLAGRFWTTHLEPILFALAWMGMWTLGGASALIVFLWQILGRETITVEGGSLVRKRAIGAMGRSREFDLAHVCNLRVSPTPFVPLIAYSFLRPGEGILAFDYGARTFRCVQGIDEPEARRLIELIQSRLPSTPHS